MIKPDPQFPDNARVKLRDGVNPNFYGGYGLPGNEGWIRGHHEEKYGFHKVLIEWDKDHWAYNGAEDCWTWEGHFELAEESMKADEDNTDDALAKIVASFAKELKGVMDGKPTELEAPKDNGVSTIIDAERAEKDEDVSNLSYKETLQKAVEAAEAADAFVLIAVKKLSVTEHVESVLPVVYHAADDMRSSLVCNVQVGHWATDFMDGLASERLRVEDE